MKIVNALFLDYLTAPLNGGADDDEMVNFYFNVEVNDQGVMKNLIKEIIKPYVAKYSEVFLMRMKDSLSYHLSNNKIDFERLFNSNLLPFDHPRDARQFYIWIWEVLFEGEDYKMAGMEEVVEVDDFSEPFKLL